VTDLSGHSRPKDCGLVDLLLKSKADQCTEPSLKKRRIDGGNDVAPSQTSNHPVLIHRRVNLPLGMLGFLGFEDTEDLVLQDIHASYDRNTVIFYTYDVKRKPLLTMSVKEIQHPDLYTELSLMAPFFTSSRSLRDISRVKYSTSIYLYRNRSGSFQFYHDLRCWLVPEAEGATLAKGKLPFVENLFKYCFGSETQIRLAPRSFYESIPPPLQCPPGQQIRPYGLDAVLLPFQQRSVHWMLNREGCELREEKAWPLSHPQERRWPPILYVSKFDATGDPVLVNRLQFDVIKDTSDAKENLVPDLNVSGGLLAEMMGLGKTVELIALILMHRKIKNEKYTHLSELIQSSATLIITPPSILEQWLEEFARHAPILRVFHYKGARVKASISEEALSQYDVVITTYPVLSREIHYVQVGPDRAMRHERKYEKRKSPLVGIRWWRVCLDEAQMVEGGTSSAAVVARTVPRVHAWAVTGTPVGKDVSDLLGILIFLQYEPFCSQHGLWNRFVSQGEFAHSFRRLFTTITCRHSKEQVRNELHLPRQHRVHLALPFTPVEEHLYQQTFQEFLDDCGMTETGAPNRNDWVPDNAMHQRMRRWLVRLRQICNHPQIGEGNRQALGGGPLRSIEDVLEVMIEQISSKAEQEERMYFISQIQRGQIHELEKEIETALEVWQSSLEGVKSAVEVKRYQIDSYMAAKAQQVTEEDSDTQDDDTILEKVIDRTQGILSNQLRHWLDLEHRLNFFIGSAYFQLENEAMETEFYDRAEENRKDVRTD